MGKQAAVGRGKLVVERNSWDPQTRYSLAKMGWGMASWGRWEGHWDAGCISKPRDCWLLDQRPDTVLRLSGFYKPWQEERGGHGCVPPRRVKGELEKGRPSSVAQEKGVYRKPKQDPGSHAACSKQQS